MSWEGYGIRICKHGCKTYFDPYDESTDLSKEITCPSCGAKIEKEILVDQTNGDYLLKMKKEKEMQKLSLKLQNSSIENIKFNIQMLLNKKKNAIENNKFNIQMLLNKKKNAIENNKKFIKSLDKKINTLKEKLNNFKT